MKISKLFHWLYAILMLLPFLVFLPNAFYYGFNKQAVAQEKTEQVPVYYESNEISSFSDFVVGNIYHWDNNFETQSPISSSQTLIYCSWISLLSEDTQNIQIFLDTSGDIFIRYAVNNGTGYRKISLEECDFVVSGLGNHSYFTTYIISKFSKSDFLKVKEYQPLVTNMSITDSMSYAWDSVWQNDLFSWSYGSFLTQPFIYIGNVFNVPVDNSLYYALSYWLDISIIWLCFDVIMYVPLLVHRWLDKGIVE